MPLPPTDLVPAEVLLTTLLDLSQTGVLLLRPVFADAEIVDFDWAYLNPAAQRMLNLPAQPTHSFLALFPTARAAGVFDFYRQAFGSGQPAHRQNNYQHDGLDGYYYLAAQRQDAVLVVSFSDSSDRPRAAVEEDLRRSQTQALEAHAVAEYERNLLRALLTQAPVAVALFQGDDCTVTLANDPICAIWGYAPAQVVGRPLEVGVPELRGQGFAALVAEVARTRVPFVGTEVPVELLTDGALRTRYFNFVFQPLLGTSDEVLGVLDIATEVTAQVQDRQRAEASAEALDIRNRDLDRLLETQAAANAELQAANAALARAQQELQALNEELETRVAQRTAETEAALHEAQAQREQLRVQQQLLRQILGQVPASIATLSSPDHWFSFFNDRYQDLVGHRAVLGRRVVELLPEAVDQGFIALLDEVYASGQPFVGTDVPIAFVDHADGPPRHHYLDFVYQPLFDDQGRVQGILAFAVDVTERVLARQQVQVLNDQLATANAGLETANHALAATNQQLRRTNTELDTFVYTASHDLRAPITNLEGLLGALREELPPAALARPLVPKMLDMVDDSIDRFQQTLGHLTDIAHLQEPDRQRPETVAVPALVEAVRRDLAPLLAATQGTLTVDLDACQEVHFSPKNLRSIVYNLLSNGLKYHAPDRRPVVHLRCHCPAGEVVFEVQDNGLGLDPAQQSELFGMFRRLHTHVEGSGVGLYTVKKIAENAGGRVAVVSTPGVGSTFTVALPVGRPV